MLKAIALFRCTSALRAGRTLYTSSIAACRGTEGVAGYGDFYSVLWLSRDCEPADIKASYVKIARACHPDVTDCPEAAASFQRAAEVREH